MSQITTDDVKKVSEICKDNYKVYKKLLELFSDESFLKRYNTERELKKLIDNRINEIKLKSEKASNFFYKICEEKKICNSYRALETILTSYTISGEFSSLDYWEEGKNFIEESVGIKIDFYKNYSCEFHSF